MSVAGAFWARNAFNDCDFGRSPLQGLSGGFPIGKRGSFERTRDRNMWHPGFAIYVRRNEREHVAKSESVFLPSFVILGFHTRHDARRFSLWKGFKPGDRKIARRR